MPIYFDKVDPAAKPGEYMSKEDPSPYFSLENGEETIKFMLNPDQVVIKKPIITLKIDYPLENPVLLPLQAPDPNVGFTRKQLALGISNIYKWMYDVEKRTTRLPIQNIPGLLNRDNTNGYFGIWGHHLGDLDLHTVTFDRTNNIYILGIDS